jgi:glutathione synthetase
MDTDDLAVQANSYASANGIQVERRRGAATDDTKATTTTYFEGAPMSLLPNAYPRAAFEQACSVAPAFNELVDKVSRDAEFLEATLGGGVSSMDPYTAKILEMYKEIYGDDGTAYAVAKGADRLGIHRSDYMLHKDDDENNSNNDNSYQLKQVELNTIASSFAGLSCKIAKLHRYLTSRYETETNEFLQANVEKVMQGASKGNFGVPSNPALEELPLGIMVAYSRYVERFETKQPPVVLFVVQDGETNTVDQRLLEFALWENHGIPVVRRSLTALDSDLVVHETTGAMTLSSLDGTEVAVVYFRAGYAPTDYPDGDNGIEWRARKTLETSRATKCPCLGYHLAGTKKVQQELARPGVLERFFPDDEDKVEAMRDCFAGLYSMGDDATEEDLGAVRAVLDGGEGGYVLKPQREGGGYNFYGENLAKKLSENVVRDDVGTIQLSDELAEYILMQRLFPPQQTAILMRGGKVEGKGESISELGAFGTLVVDSEGRIIHNQYAGFLLRTKFSNVDEGGVASGFATLSSPYLC